ncbi:cytochrome b/b6 domain-containing protein [Arthrobacter sp. ok362]|uniref:cytochrome b/b6 domain-containing protein n=1 Tax=Arthrobacter sp. ok362 TaxID=1761745 RepID=UPI0008890574|nr:cytochrome b/b6 domain-containing protein [Arthrobacter sp. ok362]SDK59024.1 Thiosulfate reductase cytochrome b subunit [Arthrobacter sp. ok362]
MATLSRSIRRGLPRVAGGEPWPAAGQAPAHIATEGAAAEAAAPSESVSGEESVAAAAAQEKALGAALPGPVPAVNAGAAVPRRLRRGLPRVPGGEPWPPKGEVSVSVAALSGAPAAGATPTPTPAADAAADVAEKAVPAATSPAAAPATAPATLTMGTTSLRRGLPRVPNGEPWPPAGLAPAVAAAPSMQAAPEHIAQAHAPAASVVEAVAEAEPPGTASAPAVTAAPASAAQSVAPEKPVRPKAEARLYGSRTLGQWIKLVVLLAVGAVAAAAILVLAARGVTTLPGVPEFLERYPGAYQLPDTAEPGFPWWAQWAHFFNIFLMVLIIRSGYQVRTEQKPPAFWTPKRGGKKISINLWLHQSLDILWLVNGLIFVVLLFASGRWMRLVPTSWEAFPNALSALLQYMTLDWPVETGWVNYNSLQQIMYFLVVFIAAPLAAITGVRMSEFWPKNAKTLNKVYPVEVARAIHFPTMLFFVLFILIHVFLVFATGALRNLNHMFSGTDVVNWVGFWLFAAAIAVTAAGWYAARPLVLAPIAKLFGQVSSR